MSLLDSNIIDRTDRMALGGFIAAHAPFKTHSITTTTVGVMDRHRSVHPLPDNVIYNDGTIQVLDGDICVSGCNGIDPKWGVTGFTGRSIVFQNIRGNFTDMRRLEATNYVKITGHIGMIEGLRAKASKITLGTTWIRFNDEYCAVRNCKFDCDLLYIRDDVPKFFMCDISCREVTINDMDIFEKLSATESDSCHPLSNELIKEHIIEGRKYNTWKKLRALVNNPKRYRHQMPENPDEWLAHRDSIFPALLGLINFKGLKKINIQDSDVGMTFELGNDNLWHVKSLYLR